MEALTQMMAGIEPYWGWWIAAVLLVILEVFAPGAVFLWMGVSAGVVGVVALLVPQVGYELQFLIFGVLSVVSILAARRYLKDRPIATDLPMLNRRGSQYVGRSFTLAEDIKDGRGRLHVDDTMWKIEGPNLRAGTVIRVVAADGVILKVEPAEVPQARSPGTAAA